MGRTAPTAPGGHGAGSARAGGPQAALAQDPAAALAHYPSFDHVVELIRANRDGRLLVEVETGVRLVSYQPGRIEFEPAPGAARDLAQDLGRKLQLWTGNRWAITVVNEGGRPTIDEERNAERYAREAEAAEHPLVQAVLARFPKARIADIRTPEQIEQAAQSEALPEVEDEWDPFEDM